MNENIMQILLLIFSPFVLVIMVLLGILVNYVFKYIFIALAKAGIKPMNDYDFFMLRSYIGIVLMLAWGIWSYNNGQIFVW